MSAWSWLLRLAQKDDDSEEEVGRPGPVLDEHGEPVVGPDGEPLMKVLVTTRRDYLGHPDERVWVDPRIAWQYRDTAWRDQP